MPSTAGVGTSNAMLATAPAVYSPTPGSSRRVPGSPGTRPSNRSRTIRAARWRFRARE